MKRHPLAVLGIPDEVAALLGRVPDRQEAFFNGLRKAYAAGLHPDLIPEFHRGEASRLLAALNSALDELEKSKYRQLRDGNPEARLSSFDRINLVAENQLLQRRIKELRQNNPPVVEKKNPILTELVSAYIFDDRVRYHLCSLDLDEPVVLFESWDGLGPRELRLQSVNRWCSRIWLLDNRGRLFDTHWLVRRQVPKVGASRLARYRFYKKRAERLLSVVKSFRRGRSLGSIFGRIATFRLLGSAAVPGKNDIRKFEFCGREPDQEQLKLLSSFRPRLERHRAMIYRDRLRSDGRGTNIFVSSRIQEVVSIEGMLTEAEEIVRTPIPD